MSDSWSSSEEQSSSIARKAVSTPPRKYASSDVDRYETLKPVELYNLLVETLQGESSERVTIFLEKGRVSSDIRDKSSVQNPGTWMSLDPSSQIRDYNKATCVIKLGGRSFRFPVGLLANPIRGGLSMYYIRGEATAADWSSFTLIDHRSFADPAKTGEKKTKKDEEKKRGREKEPEERKDLFPKKGKESKIITATPLQTVRLLEQGGELELVGKEGIPGSRIAKDGSSWLCLDTLNPKQSPLRQFSFEKNGQTYQFSASIDVQRRNGHRFFIQIGNVIGQKNYSVLAIDYRPSRADAPEGDEQPLKKQVVEKKAEVKKVAPPPSKKVAVVVSPPIRAQKVDPDDEDPTKALFMQQFQAQWDLFRAAQTRIKQLEGELDSTRSQESSKYDLLCGEIEILKTGMAHAESQRLQAERKLTMLTDSLKHK